FVSAADISCAAKPPETKPLVLFIATRNFGIDWTTLERRLLIDPSLTDTPPYHYSCELPLRPEIGAREDGKPHFGGIYAVELVNTGTELNPVYAIYLTVAPGMIKVTP
ncbi:MAG TPA: hypothetical protein VHY08_09155, partial [Bacillota bacterium]|nr:hypothetical protein [Bacillota bacterium]